MLNVILFYIYSILISKLLFYIYSACSFIFMFSFQIYTFFLEFFFLLSSRIVYLHLEYLSILLIISVLYKAYLLESKVKS